MIFNILVLGGGLICALILIARFVYRNVLGHTAVRHLKKGCKSRMKGWPESDCAWIPEAKRW